MSVENYKPGVFIADVPNWHAMGKVRVLVFNQFRVELYGLTGPGDTYKMYTEGRLSKGKIDLIRSFIDGILATLRSL